MSNEYQLGSNACPADFYTLDSVASDHAVTFTGGARALRVGGSAGDVELVTFEGNTVVVPNVQVGEVHFGIFTEIKAANTTAQGITVYR